MATRPAKTTITMEKAVPAEPAEEPAAAVVAEPLGQRKRPEAGQFHLQVDRQTKGSYSTFAAAEAAGMVIKKGHPILQVAVYNMADSTNTILALPAE